MVTDLGEGKQFKPDKTDLVSHPGHAEGLVCVCVCVCVQETKLSSGIVLQHNNRVSSEFTNDDILQL